MDPGNECRDGGDFGHESKRALVLVTPARSKRSAEGEHVGDKPLAEGESGPVARPSRENDNGSLG